MGKSAPTPPPAPDPTQIANAQSASNQQTAQLQQKLNMVNTLGPSGTVSYVADPNSPGGYTQQTTLSPEQQGLYHSYTGAQQGALDVAGQQIGRVGQALGQGLNPSDYGSLTHGVQGGPLQTSFDQGQAVHGQVGPQNIGTAVQDAANSAYSQARSRLDPQWNTAQQQEQTRLANQGLDPNSAAYQNAMDIFNRSKNDAYQQAGYGATQLGDQEQQQLFGQQLNQGQFANAAAGQQYAQNQGQAAFNNAAQGQGFNQGYQNAQLGNTAQQQGFQQGAYAQSLPIQEFAQLMGQGQVSSPQGINYTPTQVGTTDVTGAYGLATDAAQKNYQTQMQNYNSSNQGLFGLGAAALQAAPMMFSDRRLKRDIARLGTRTDGAGVYAYRYLWSDEPQFGVMADEIERVRPEAVHDVGGFLAVDYGAL